MSILSAEQIAAAEAVIEENRARLEPVYESYVTSIRLLANNEQLKEMVERIAEFGNKLPQDDRRFTNLRRAAINVQNTFGGLNGTLEHMQ